MNILILGEGGFARNLGNKLKLSHHYDTHFSIPAIDENQAFEPILKIALNDENEIAHFCVEQKIDVVIIANVDGLANGLYNKLKNNHLLKRAIIIGASSETVEFLTNENSLNNFIIENNIPFSKNESNELEKDKIDQIVILTNGNTFKILNDISLNNIQQIEQKIITPTLNGLLNKSFLISGFLCCNIIQKDEIFELINYQFVIDDKVAELIFEKLETDVLSLFAAMDNGTLEDVNIEFYEK